MLRLFSLIALFTLLVYVVPVAVKAALYWRTASGNWRAADRSSAGLLPPATAKTPAMVRVYAARTVSWRGIVAVHSWIVLKEAGGRYERYDLTAWGEPIRVNGFEPDGRWFGQMPTEVLSADGAQAAAAIPPLRAAIASYRYRHLGDYNAWPGPNSNTFVAAVMAAVPGLTASLPPTAIGKDFPVDGRWLAPTPSGTGFRLSLGGYAGLTVAWVEGLQMNLLGLVAGIDIRRPAIELPGIGRLALVG
jgi:hypothetical protein